MDRPNVLILMSDEHPVFMTGCYGHRSVKTPHIDSLAKAGAVFDAAYCPSPISSASRACMMTGRHPHVIEAWDNSSPLRSDWPTFAHSFRAAGYHAALCGKMHFVGPDQLHGFCERWTQDIYPATFDWSRSNRDSVAVNEGQNIDRVFEAGPGRTADMDYDEEVLFRAEYGLRRHARLNSDQPLMLCVSFTGPHYPFKAPQEYWDLYTDDDVDLPDIPGDLKDHEYVSWLRTHGKFHKRVPDDVCRAARQAILARTTMVDEYFGKIVEVLGECGMSENTIIVYASDHGDMMGERGLWYKNAAYEWSSRVPLIFTGPGIGASRIAEPANLLDLGPTLCGLVGVEPAYGESDGRDLSDLVRGERTDGDGQSVVEYYGEGTRRGWRMIRRGDYKLTYVPGCQSELYNVAADPSEWNDLAADPAHADVRADLEARVLSGWDPDACDEKRYRSEERRLAILKSLENGPPLDWQSPSPAVPHPLRGDADGTIDNVDS